MSCASPIPYEQLVALWAGELADAEAEAVDAHLFACDECALASQRLGALVSGLREVLPPVISHAQRDRLIARGQRLRLTDVEAGRDPVDAVFSPDVDLLVHVLHGDFTAAERVDVEILLPQGDTLTRLLSVPFDRARGELLIACQRHYEQLGPGDPVFRVHVHAPDQRTPRDYHVRHVWL